MIDEKGWRRRRRRRRRRVVVVRHLYFVMTRDYAILNYTFLYRTHIKIIG
jgi:hypothetical protein